AYRWYANDTLGRLNESITGTFIVANTAPSITFVTINATDHPINTTLANLTAFNSSITDLDNDRTKMIWDWRKDGVSDAVLNMPFENNSAWDASTNNNHGSLENGVVYNSTSGYDGFGAFQFDGVNDFINIDSVQTTLASTTQGTWTAWIKPVDATPLNSETFIAFGDVDANEFIYITILPTSKFNAFSRSAAGLKFTLQTDSAVFLDNTWTHVTLVQDGVSPVIYIDGVAVAQTFSTEIDKTHWFNDAPNLDNGRIGDVNRNNDGETLHFNGTIDGVKIYDRALSSDEIKRLYLQRNELQNSYVSQKDVFIDSTGNVGIGTDSPNQNLHVVGNINVTGNLYVGGCITYNYTGTPVTLGTCV
ncbi:hypothetical protein LCGC14_2854740, partial [marine sediment metagenome]